MSKGTIVRTIMLALVLVNLALEKMGLSVISADEGTVAEVVEYLISAAVVVLSWWKNNSVTKNAQKADEYLAWLKNLEEGENEQ